MSQTADDEVLDTSSFWAVAKKMAARRRGLHTTSPGPPLRRRLGVTDLVMIGVGASVGSGIFVIVGVAVKPVGPAVAISFALAAFSSIFSAYCYAELASRVPVTGSICLYAHFAFGELIALIFGLNFLVDSHISAALGSLTCATYLRKTLVNIFHFEGIPSPNVLAVLILASVTCTLVGGVDKGLKKANSTLVFLKVSIVLIIILIGSTKMEVENLEPFMPNGFTPVLAMTSTCTFSYIGFGTVATAAEECVNPRRDLPIGILISLAICGVLYVAFSLVLCGIVPFQEIDAAAPVDDAFSPRYADLPWVRLLVNIGAVAGVYTTLLTGMYSQGRMYLSMSRDGLLGKYLSDISERFNTPVRAQVMVGAVASVLSLCGGIQGLVHFINVGVLAAYTVVCAGVLVMRADKSGTAAAGSAVTTVVTITGSVLAPRLCELPALSGYHPLVYGGTVLAVLLCWTPMLTMQYSVPKAAFACPLCPWVPLIGITLNGFLLSQCYWQAWVRIGATTLLIMLAYGLRVRKTWKKLRNQGTGITDSLLPPLWDDHVEPPPGTQ